MSLKENVLIVSHDAGGAEVISAWVQKHIDRYSFHFLLAGPALKIFEQKLAEKKLNYCANFKDYKKFNWILTGTSWASDIEKQAIQLAHQLQIPVFSYLDHWCNYKERFILNGELLLPDEIWVGDRHAEKRANKIFSKCKIRYVENEYFLYLKNHFSDTKNYHHESVNILYICEPIGEYAKKKFGDEYYWGYTEFEIMQKFFAYLKAKYKSYKPRIHIRLHPAEIKGKYDKLFEEANGFSLYLSENNSLLDDIVTNDWIVGSSSMALVIALIAEKRVSSCLSRGSALFCLPFEEIEHLNLM